MTHVIVDANLRMPDVEKVIGTDRLKVIDLRLYCGDL